MQTSDLYLASPSRQDSYTAKIETDLFTTSILHSHPKDDLRFDEIITDSRQCEILNEKSSRHIQILSNQKHLENCCYKTQQEDTSKTKSIKQCSISLLVEGPIGSAMEDIHKYKVSLCVAGGIGITPFASILNSFL